MKHTKTPWEIQDDHYPGYVIKKNNSDEIVADVILLKEDAEFIVRAVNSYDESEQKLNLACGFADLFKAQRDELLEAAKQAYISLCDGDVFDKVDAKLKLKQVIAKVDGK